MLPLLGNDKDDDMLMTSNHEAVIDLQSRKQARVIQFLEKAHTDITLYSHYQNQQHIRQL